MKKFLFRTLMVLILIIGAYTKALGDARQPVQVHPDSPLQIKTVNQEAMRKVQETKKLRPQENDINREKNHAYGKSLSPPQIIDDRMDQEKTMELMGKYFKALKKASGLKAMFKPAQNLEKWAAQAQALGLKEVHKQPATVKQQRGFEKGMISLREQIAALKAAIEKEDQASASLILKQINEIRKVNHKLFK